MCKIKKTTLRFCVCISTSIEAYIPTSNVALSKWKASEWFKHNVSRFSILVILLSLHQLAGMDTDSKMKRLLHKLDVSTTLKHRHNLFSCFWDHCWSWKLVIGHGQVLTPVTLVYYYRLSFALKAVTTNSLDLYCFVSGFVNFKGSFRDIFYFSFKLYSLFIIIRITGRDI